MQKKSRKKENSLVSKKKTSRQRVKRKTKKMSVMEDTGKIFVHQGGAAPLNVLNLRDKEDEVLKTVEVEIPRARELTWRDYYNTDSRRSLRIATLRCDFFNAIQNRSGQADHGFGESRFGSLGDGAGVNFLERANKTNKTNVTNATNGFLDLLASLPRDFIFFYKVRFKLLFRLIQWNLEEVGKLPFRIIFWILRTLEILIIRPLARLICRATVSFCYFWRRLFAEIFWIFKMGFSILLNFPLRLLLFLRPAPARAWSKNVLAFAIVCLAIILPFGAYIHLNKLKKTEGKVLGVTAEAYGYLQAAQSATKQLDFEKAGEEFKKANEGFLLAQKEMDGLNFLISGLIDVLPKGQAAQKILEAGKAMSEAGVYMTEGLNVIDNKEIRNKKLEIRNTDVDGLKQITTDGTDNGSSISSISSEVAMENVDLGVAEKVKAIQASFNKAYPKIILAKKNLEDIDPLILPAENRENFEQVKNKVLKLEALSRKMVSFSKIINEILAIDSSKRFLVIFQNENEMRPTGGFMGSFALLDVKDGVIEKIEVPGGGPYDLKVALTKRVAPPKPLQVVNDQWQMQDANWFADFPESAKKIMWFYENSGGSTVDGVIAITSGIVPELLELTGPIEMPEYDKIIDKDNFYLETQMAVEEEYDKAENRPKEFIADLAPKLLEKIMKVKSDKLIDLLGVVDLGLTEKKVMFYFSEPEVQKEAADNNWAGEVRKVGEEDDYFMAVNANVNGGKTDGAITQKVVHETEIEEDGGLVDTVTIIRKHNGGPEDLFANKKNIDYLRIYAPRGSTLLEAKGFTPLGRGNFHDLAPGVATDEDLERIEGSVLIDETTSMRITNEFGKTVFGNWIVLNPGETSICKVKYRLPWTIDLVDLESVKDKVYTLLIQKQPGSKEDEIEKLIFTPKESELTWKYPEDEFVGKYEGLVKFRSALDADRYFGVIFK